MSLYLDIETSRAGAITIIGILNDQDDAPPAQLTPDFQNSDALRAFLPTGANLYTFNGARFDLPRLHAALGVDVAARCRHVDLLVSCRAAGLRGTQKEIEARIQHGGYQGRIPSDLTRKKAPAPSFGGSPPTFAPRKSPNTFALWDRFSRKGDGEALRELLAYNRDDLAGLVTIRRFLAERGLMPARFGGP